MSQSSAVASSELAQESEDINNIGSRRSMVTSNNDNEEGNNKSAAPSVHSSDDTVVRRGDGKFKKKDPTRIAHGIMNNYQHAFNISSLFRGGRSRTTSAQRTAQQPTIQEENDGVTCGCNWFRRWTRKDELRWV